MARYNLCVKIGEYESGGETKNRWQKIGRLMPGKDGGYFALLDALYISTQLNGLANKEHKDAIIVSCFEEDGDKGSSGGSGRTGQSSGGSSGGQSAPPSDDIPF